MLHHMATILICYGGHFEPKMAAKIQKSSYLDEIWFASRLWSTCIVRLGDICNVLHYSNQYLYVAMHFVVYQMLNI
jgi:hypothetical protein